ncbi:MAG: pilus assembly protein [Gammaproteobacteria bacterium]|nr:MAG: pilus assembly protein [Gammaproteobacteria bacterium]PHR80542.1 MAG: pilus assembly protein [Colwellia sp.]
MDCFPRRYFYSGFTLIELMISISILSILTAIAYPNLNAFLSQMRVDNEISVLHRLLFSARNAAINNALPVTICPLNDQNQCTTQWQNEISVFFDLNNNNTYDPINNEILLRTKSAIKSDDKLQYGLWRSRIIYAPTGRTSGWGSNGTFKYCPKDYPEKSRAISIATSGRLYMSSDIDQDGKDEVRSGSEINCRAE